MKRALWISAAAVLLTATASPAMADHSRVAVSVNYGPAQVHYVDRDWYRGSHRFLGARDFRRDYWRNGYRRYYWRDGRRYLKPRFRHRARFARPHLRHRNWCPINRPHWH